MSVFQLILGLALALGGWVALRRVAMAPWLDPRAMALDVAPVLACWLLMLGVTARPLSSGLITFGLGVGLAIVDNTKRAVLREPVLFSDMLSFRQLFIHPRLYFPFASRFLVAGTTAAIAVALLLFISLEHPLWVYPWPAIPVLGAYAAAIYFLAKEPYLSRAAHWLKGFELSDDPALDSARIGPLATLFAYGIIARSERENRQALAHPHFRLNDTAHLPDETGMLPTMIVIQGESFFDAQRLSPRIKGSLLASFRHLQKTAASFGRMRVNAWGANTVRTEFGVLSGLDDLALGFDRFNPYHAFAKRRLPGLAATLREAGYRTICIHPFDRKFFDRDTILNQLGFDRFLGAEAFPKPDLLNGWISDRSVGEVVRKVLAEEGPQCFVFVITMENHGPWLNDSINALGFDPAPGISGSEFTQLRRYLSGLGSFDELIGAVYGALSASDYPAVLGIYGDHLPSLPKTFEALRFNATDTDYLIWRSGRHDPLERDLAPYEFATALLDIAFDRHGAHTSLQQIDL